MVKASGRKEEKKKSNPVSVLLNLELVFVFFAFNTSSHWRNLKIILFLINTHNRLLPNVHFQGSLSEISKWPKRPFSGCTYNLPLDPGRCQPPGSGTTGQPGSFAQAASRLPTPRPSTQVEKRGKHQSKVRWKQVSQRRSQKQEKPNPHTKHLSGSPQAASFPFYKFYF